MLVQIYETTSAAEARALAALGVDNVGVLVGPGEFPREQGADAARAIFAALPPGVRRVALSLSADLATIAGVIEGAAPDIIHLGAAPELLPPVAARRLRGQFPAVALMRSIPVTGPESIAVAEAYEGIADFLLLDSHTPGDRQVGAQGRTHDWALSRAIVERVGPSVILAGGLGPENVAAAIGAVRPAGVDSKTRTDRPDGAAKDLDLVRAFVARAKAG